MRLAFIEIICFILVQHSFSLESEECQAVNAEIEQFMGGDVYKRIDTFADNIIANKENSQIKHTKIEELRDDLEKFINNDRIFIEKLLISSIKIFEKFESTQDSVLEENIHVTSPYDFMSPIWDFIWKALDKIDLNLDGNEDNLNKCVKQKVRDYYNYYCKYMGKFVDHIYTLDLNIKGSALDSITFYRADFLKTINSQNLKMAKCALRIKHNTEIREKYLEFIRNDNEALLKDIYNNVQTPDATLIRTMKSYIGFYIIWTLSEENITEKEKDDNIKIACNLIDNRVKQYLGVEICDKIPEIKEEVDKVKTEYENEDKILTVDGQKNDESDIPDNIPSNSDINKDKKVDNKPEINGEDETKEEVDLEKETENQDQDIFDDNDNPDKHLSNFKLFNISILL